MACASKLAEEGSAGGVLVIGGGIAGITAALELANMGVKVHLIEKRPAIGGNMAKLTKVFPTLDDAQSLLKPRMDAVWRHPNINLLTSAEVQEVSGQAGNYRVRVHVRPRGVDVKKCTACGMCTKVCPVEVSDDFNEGPLN
jgi:heterodisulfide reductase subunit A